MELLDYYFGKIAAAFVRGKLASELDRSPLSERLLKTPLDDLSEIELVEIIQTGLAAALRLHKFKQTMGLARVQKVLGILKGLAPLELLDIGSGRGTFLWPLVDSFPDLPITAIDKDEQRVADILAVHSGGFANISAQIMNATTLDLDNDSFDIVTMLEVLEHIPAAPEALREVVRVAKRFVVISVPSKEDDNPEHIHLFNQDSLNRMLIAAGALRVRCEYVLNHLIAVAKVC
ncbi:MAG: class I SAM-dependent methyltransferase [Acidobacteriota bacterium]